MFTAVNRGYVNAPAIKKYFDLRLEKYDIIIGKIADDCMNNVMSLFFEDHIKSIPFVKALEIIELGKQFVLKTQNACDNIINIELVSISVAERKRIKEADWKTRGEKFSRTKGTLKKYYDEGEFFSDIIEKMEKRASLRVKVLEENKRNLASFNEKQIFSPKM